MPVEVLLVGAAALAAATIAGVTGFGGAVLLLPVLVWAVGARDAVVVLTVAQLVGNASRVAFTRDDVDTAVLKRFSVGAVPLALIGGALFAALPTTVLGRLLGGFLIGAFVWRHAASAQPRQFALHRFTIIGAVFGFLSATGSWLGKHILDHTPEHVFATLIDAVLVSSGLLLVLSG